MMKNLRYQIFCNRLKQRGLALSKKQPIKPMTDPIDFVVTWVDGNDPEWREQRDRYAKELGRASTADSGDPRFRDWEIFKYWFRAVEQYAPWVRNVYLVTYGHVPEWLKTDAPKLKIVKHTDFIPEEYLPTFSSISIELNLHRIQGLSEHFVYFNDDMFLNQLVYPEDFFQAGKPNCAAVSMPLLPNEDLFQHMVLECVGMVNTAFKGRFCQIVNAHPEKWFAYQYGELRKHNQYAYDQNCLTGMVFSHSAAPLRKSTMHHVWQHYEERFSETCSHRFRTLTDVFHWVFGMWDMMKNEFEPVSTEHFGRAFVVDCLNPILDAVAKGNDRVICINDSYQITYEEYKQYKRLLIDAMEKKYPNKSVFEK